VKKNRDTYGIYPTKFASPTQKHKKIIETPNQTIEIKKKSQIKVCLVLGKSQLSTLFYMNWQRILQNASNFIIWCLNQCVHTYFLFLSKFFFVSICGVLIFFYQTVFCMKQSESLLADCTERPVSKVMKTVIEFLKILPDTTSFPNFAGEKIFNTKAYIKKIKSIDGRLLAHF
jgi:hypothetical protein